MTKTRHRLLCMKVVHTIKFWLIVCCVTRDPVGSSVQSHKYSKQCYVHSLYVIKLHACAGKELTKHPLIPLRAWRLHDFKYKLLLLQQEKLAALLTWSRLAWLCNGQGEASLATRLHADSIFRISASTTLMNFIKLHKRWVIWIQPAVELESNMPVMQ